MEAVKMCAARGRMAVALACTAALAAALSGCVRPGEIDGRVITRYQRAMAQRTPQPRGEGDTGELFQPAGEIKLPPLAAAEGEPGEPKRVELSLEQAIIYALAGSPEIGVASFDPAISRQEMTRAAAEFDLVANAGFSYDKQDIRTDSAFGGGVAKVKEFSAGVERKLVTGAEWTLGWTMTRTWDNSTFRALNPRYEPIVSLEVTQPLLRGAWPEFNLARLRLARLTHRQSISEFRGKVEEVVTDVYSAYWQLIQARREVEIQEDLLEATRSTLRRVQARRAVDAPRKTAIKQVEAALHARQASLILARRRVEDVEEQLARLISHRRLGPVESFVLVPTTEITTRKPELVREDELLTALRHSPALEQARLAIAAADINVRVATNETLPRLDLTASTTAQGLGATWHQGDDRLESLDYVGYGVALELEYPLGNRAALAQQRRARLQRRQAVAGMQAAADRIAQQVSERIRAVETAWQRVKVQQAAAAAAAEHAEGLEDRLMAIGQMSPEFLLTLLQAQENFAQARRSVWQAMTDYNVARVELDEVTGTVLDRSPVKVALPPASAEGE